jgi:hypothetical protein
MGLRVIGAVPAGSSKASRAVVNRFFIILKRYRVTLFKGDQLCQRSSAIRKGQLVHHPRWRRRTSQLLAWK